MNKNQGAQRPSGMTLAGSRLVDCLPSYHDTQSQRNQEKDKGETTTTHLRIRNRTENVDGARNYTSEYLLFW